MGLGYVELKRETNGVGNESTSPTLTTKKLYPRLRSFQPNLGPSPLERDDELLNHDEAVAILPEAFDPSYDIEMRAYPDALGFLLSCLLGAPTTTAGDGVITDPDTVAIPVNAYRHVWTAPGGPSGVSPATFQAIAAYTEQAFYAKLKGCAVQSLDIDTPDKGGASLKAAGPACYIERISDPSLTAAYESDSIPPFLRPHLTLSWLSGSAATRDFTLNFSQQLDVQHTAGSGSKYPDIIYKGDGPIVLSGSVPKELVDIQDWDALVAATAFAATAKWVSTAIIASSYPYKLFVEMPNCQYMEGGADALTNARRRGASFSWKATRAGSASWTVTLVNATSSYA